MKAQARVLVIGGGVVGCSVLYHLTKLGWSDIDADGRVDRRPGHAKACTRSATTPNVAKLKTTIRLYRELEQISGQSCGIHRPGGIMLAGTPEQLDFLKTTHARGRLLGLASSSRSTRPGGAIR